MPSACPRCGRPVAASARRCPSCDKVLRAPVQLETPRPAELPPIGRSHQTRPGQPRQTQPPPHGQPSQQDQPVEPGQSPQQGRPAQQGQPPQYGQPVRTKAEERTEAAVEKTRAGVRVGMRLLRRLPRRARFVLLAVVVALVVGVPATIWIIGKVAYSPEEPVDDLVSAFNDGNLRRAAELAGCTARLCQPAALRDGYRAPENMSIDRVAMGGSTNPDSADVILSYDLAGERRQSVIRVKRESGLLPQSWSIGSGAVGTLEIVAPSVKSVRVAGLDIDPAGGKREPALIGAYSVTVGGDDPLYEGEPIEATISGDLRNRPVTSVNLATAVRQSAREEVSTQVRTFLDKCAAQDAQKPRVDGRPCPFSYSGYFPPGSSDVSWLLDPAPVFEVVVPENPRDGVVLEVRTTTPGQAKFRYTFQGAPYEADPVPVSIKGEVRLTDGKIQFIAS